MDKNKTFVDEALVSEVFASEKKEQAMALFDGVGDSVTAIATEAVDRAMIDNGIFRRAVPANKGTRLVRELKSIFDNNGIDPRTGEKWSIADFQNVDKELFDAIKTNKANPRDYADLQMSGDQPLLMPRVVSQTVREALEPALLLTPLLQRINFSNGTTITFPAISSMMAGDLRIAERGEYPEGKLQFAGQITASIGKHGIKVSMTEEAIKYSIMDIWAMNLRAAGRALAKHKEQQVVDQIFGQGQIYFDNSTISGRKTTGRDMTGAFNGTFTQDDLFEMWADLVKDGFVPDTIMMHPFAWPIFARDPVLRNLAYINGGGPVISNGYQGKPGSAPSQWDLGGLNQQRNLTEPANQATTFSPVPGTFPFGQIRMIITPFVNYDTTSNFTDIWIFDSRDLGVMVVDEDVMTEEWKDPEHDIRSIKLRERYALANANNGRSIRRAKNVVVTKSYDFSLSTLSAQITLDTSEIIIS
jgi:hypothetical protein